MVSGLKRDKHWKTFALPKISTGAAKAAASCVGEGPHGFWSLRHAVALNGDGPKGNFGGLLASTAGANEVETNPPYCPFHIDARVNIYAFDDSETFDSQIGLHGRPQPASLDFRAQGHGYDEVLWVFGESLPSSTKVNDLHVLDEIEGEGDLGDVDMDDMAGQVESRLTIAPAGHEGGVEQIRVNSRRSRRGGGGGVDGGGGAGFDFVDIDDEETV